jgi:hypothetical protein
MADRELSKVPAWLPGLLRHCTALAPLALTEKVRREA